MPWVTFCLVAVLLLVSACSKTVGSHSPLERERLSILYSQIALEFILNQNVDVARGEAEEALRLNPKGVAANHAMARVYQALNNNEQVITHFQRALRTDPNSMIVRNDYGQFLCERDRAQEAMTQFKHAGRQLMSPLRMISYTRAAACLIRHNNYNDAQMYLLKALELNSNSLPVLFNLARVSYLQNNNDRASHYLARYFNTTQTPSRDALALAKKLKMKP